MHDFVELYLDERIRRGDLAPSSVPVIRTTLLRFSRHVGGDIARLSELDVTTWLDDRYSANTRKSMLTKLRPFIRWMVRERFIPRDITAGITVHISSHEAPRDLPADSIERLFAELPDFRARLIVVLMLQCGLRCGEVARIRIEDIDQRRRVLGVRGKGGRGQVNGYVPIPDEAWAMVIAALRQHRALAGAFVLSYNSPRGPLTPHTMSKLVGRWMKAAGLKSLPHDGVSAHALRHTCAQDLHDSGADPRTVQYALRHKSLRTTEIYLRREPPGLRAAMEGRRYQDGPSHERWETA